MIRKGSVAVRCQIQAFLDVSINRRNQLQFKENMNPPEFICVRLSTKRTRLKKAKGFILRDRERHTVKTGLVRFRGICQPSINCSPFKISVVNGAAIIWSSSTLPAPLSTKLLRCHLHLEAITIYSYTHSYNCICGRILDFGICPQDLLCHWQQLWFPRQPQKLWSNWSKRLILLRVSSFLSLWMSRQIKLSEQQMHDADAPAPTGFFFLFFVCFFRLFIKCEIMTINVCGGE